MAIINNEYESLQSVNKQWMQNNENVLCLVIAKGFGIVHSKM